MTGTESMLGREQAMAAWGDYQTAIQLVAGLNIALYGLPELREPGIGRERLAQDAILAHANHIGQFELSIDFRARFRRLWGRMFVHFAAAGRACIVVSALTTGVLLRASGDGAKDPADPIYAWGTIGAGFVPAGWLLVLNLLYRRRLAAAAALRRELEAYLTRPRDGHALRAGA